MRAVIDQALDLNGIPHDEHTRAKWENVIMFQATRESSLNPNAVNLDDSNAHGPTAADNHPLHCDRGLLQVIPDTFTTHHITGTSTSIYDPVANTAAAVHYIIAHYHVEPTAGHTFDEYAAHRHQGGYTGY